MPGTAVQGPAWHDRSVRKDEGAATTSAELRAHNLARLLRAIHDGGGQLTRAELTRQLSLARGTATVLVRDLAGRQLIEELTSPVDATAQRARGRPTRVPAAHPRGPGAPAGAPGGPPAPPGARGAPPAAGGPASSPAPPLERPGRATAGARGEGEAGWGTGMLHEVARQLRSCNRQFGARVVGVGVAVPSPV